MEKIAIPSGGKKAIYEALIPQVEVIVGREPDLYADLANITAILKEAFDFLWVGFYLVKPDSSLHGSTLVLGPFQGPLACTRIAYGKGVCGTAWREKRTIVVPDVELFPGHIACSSLSRSEIVVPYIRSGEVLFVLDIDSAERGSFDEIDSLYLEKIIPDYLLEYCSR